MLIKKIGHKLVSFSRFRKDGVIPEAVIQPIEHNQTGIRAGAQEGAVQYRRVAEQHVPRTGHK